jgi:hypothetical protein
MLIVFVHPCLFQKKLPTYCPSRGILGILNSMTQAPTHGVAMSEAALGEAKQQLDNAAYQLMLEEVDYDTKCLSAYLSNVASFELRMQHQKDTWTKRRVDRAKEASNIAWDSKVICLGKNKINMFQVSIYHYQFVKLASFAGMPLDRCDHIAGLPSLMEGRRWPCSRRSKTLRRSGWEG